MFKQHTIFEVIYLKKPYENTEVRIIKSVHSCDLGISESWYQCEIEAKKVNNV